MFVNDKKGFINVCGKENCNKGQYLQGTWKCLIYMVNVIVCIEYLEVLNLCGERHRLTIEGSSFLWPMALH